MNEDANANANTQALWGRYRNFSDYPGYLDYPGGYGYEYYPTGHPGLLLLGVAVAVAAVAMHEVGERGTVRPRRATRRRTKRRSYNY